MTKDSIAISRTKQDLRNKITGWRKAGLTVGMVPTMGALHHGHMALVKTIKQQVDRVVVSIFVNPKQFGPHEDFDRYPRQEEQDIKTLIAADVDLLYAPSVNTIYPEGFLTTLSVAKLGEGLCGARRPGHFDGVTTVVSKLLLQCLPDVAIFGEKDFQQYVIIKQMARDMDIPTRIIGGAIVRDPDGLATSSRNVYLSAEARRIALEIPKSLHRLAAAIQQGDQAITVLIQQTIQHLESYGVAPVDYLEIRRSDNLAPVGDKITTESRILVAGTVGTTRLIDNLAIFPETVPTE